MLSVSVTFNSAFYLMNSAKSGYQSPDLCMLIALFHLWPLAFFSFGLFIHYFILIPCQSHVNSFRSLKRFIPGKSNNAIRWTTLFHPHSHQPLKRGAYFLLPFFIVFWGPVSPVHLLHAVSLLRGSLWCVILLLSPSFAGYSPLLNPLGPWASLSTIFFYKPYSQPWLPLFSCH